MLSRPFAESFAAEWIAAWNSRDLDRILSHYSDDFEFSSPFVPEVAGEPSGRLVGQAAIRAYWEKALARRADLRFESMSVLVGVGSIVILYSRHDGRVGAEQFEIDSGGKVVRSCAHNAEPRR